MQYSIHNLRFKIELEQKKILKMMKTPVFIGHNEFL